MSEKEIKPCPFCGGTAVEVIPYDEDGDYAAVFCRRKGCGASGPTVEVEDNDDGEYNEEATRSKALKAWSERRETA